MNDLIQYILVCVIVVAAITAAARAVIRAASNRKTVLTACAGCKLQDVCRKPEKNSSKKCADKVVQVKKSM